ncbi:phosphoribosyltransferase [Mesorhizobium sp. M0387]|uniref:phosphoribosyltransferase n=1 Tax=Mesorhizobium sp. M0387 TaxID=2956940 RepID=UPI0033385C77
MTEVKVWSLVRHNTTMEWGETFRNEHEWAAIHIKKIVKADTLAPKASFNWPGLGKVWPDRQAAFEASLCRMIAEKILADGHAGSVIIPVPNSSGVVGSQEGFRTMDLARRIAASSGGQLFAQDHLRWNGAVGKSHLGQRARNVDEHMARLAIVGKPDRKIVLFDDMVTSGSQMCAAKLKLEAAGYQIAACYSVLDVLDAGERGTPPEWKLINRRLSRTADLLALFEQLGPLQPPPKLAGG